MVFRTLITLVFLYFLFKFGRNLVRAILYDGQPPRQMHPPAQERASVRTPPPAPRAPAARKPDIEDARFEDL